LLYELKLGVGRDPALATDLILVPQGAALALALLAERWKLVGRGWNWEVKERASRIAEEAVWREVVECSVWSLFKLEPQQASIHIASLLDRLAGLAKVTGWNAEREEWLRYRYKILRETLVRWPERTEDALMLDH